MHRSQPVPTRKGAYERKSLIIFNAVQLDPKVGQFIKPLAADGQHDDLETGSLITIKRNMLDTGIPSEEEHLSIYLSDIEKFLWAMGDEFSSAYIQRGSRPEKPLGDALHRKAMNLFRQYMLVGGMPQTMRAYTETKDFEAAGQARRRASKAL